MSISGISSQTSFLQQSNASVPQNWQRVLQGREDFTLLAQALESGDLATAREAYADLQGLQQSLISSGTPIPGDLAALGKALATNDLSQAQSDLAQLQGDIRSRLQNRVGSHPDSASTSTSSTNLIGSTVDVTA